jgi:excisionase family DNA binding protein
MRRRDRGIAYIMISTSPPSSITNCISRCPSVLPGDERPWTVREAAAFLGVSQQTVYLWVEEKKIPHLRVMGRNIRCLRTDLEIFRASFKQEVQKY